MILRPHGASGRPGQLSTVNLELPGAAIFPFIGDAMLDLSRVCHILSGGVPVENPAGLESDIAQVTDDGGLGHGLDVGGGLVPGFDAIQEVLPVCAVSPL
jgi:hypothetical protein